MRPVGLVSYAGKKLRQTDDGQRSASWPRESYNEDLWNYALLSMLKGRNNSSGRWPYRTYTVPCVRSGGQKFVERSIAE